MRDKRRTLDKKSANLNFKKIAKKQKWQERGITLIALVVTIVILLILAGVTLNVALSDNGLFDKTKKAAEEYKQAQSEEEDLLLKYEYEMAQLQGKISETETFGEYSMEKEIKEKYGQDIKIGDTVNYKPNAEGVEEVASYDGTWKVLGIENGQILLMSSEPVADNVELNGKEGFLKLEEKLNAVCEDYGSGTGAESSRSLKVEDINKITDYNLENPKKVEKFGKGAVNEYGTDVTFKLNSEGNLVYECSNGAKLKSNATSFKHVDDRELNANLKKITVKSTAFRYACRFKDLIVGDIDYSLDLVLGENVEELFRLILRNGTDGVNTGIALASCAININTNTSSNGDVFRSLFLFFSVE